MAVSSSELTMLPTATISLDSGEAAKKVLRLIDALDDHDDVQNVYANFDIADDSSRRSRPDGGGGGASRAPTSRWPGTDGTDAGRRDYSLADYRGQVVVLVFYPGDNTPVCTRQLNAYTDDIDAFADVGAQVLAISPQSVEPATTSSPASRAASGSRCWPTPTRRWARPTASSARWASTGGRPSSSTPRASSATPTGPWPASPSAAPTSWSPPCRPRRLAGYCSSATPRSRPRVTARMPRDSATIASTQAAAPMYHTRRSPP